MRTVTSSSDISIAMATYNGGRFIREQLESLRSQTQLPNEVVITDDGSSDDTLDQIECFRKSAPFLVEIVRNTERLGWRGNFMKAASLCRGEFIAFCDQDDVWYPQKLARVMAPFADPRVLLTYHDAAITDAAGRVIGTLRGGEAGRTLLPPRSRPTTWSNPLGLTIMFRRRLTCFQKYWPLSIDPREPSKPAAHDQWHFKLAANLGYVSSTPEILLAYRQHGGNAVGFAVEGLSSPLKRRSRTPAAHYELMLSAFCRVLSQAQADGLSDSFPELPAALDANEQLLDRLRKNHVARHDRRIWRRLAHFGSLVQTGAYSRRTPWNLGYRALLDTALAVPFGR